jgi:hypothetical protein
MILCLVSDTLSQHSLQQCDPNPSAGEVTLLL